MVRFALFSTLILINILGSHCLQQDHTWREYTGTIPEDAIVGGKDINEKNIYIGQAYVKDGGLIVAQIVPGIREVYAPHHGAKKIDNYVKILCGPQENFYWEPANSTHLHLQLIGKHAVIGGHEDGGGILNVGRISHEGETKIGKITAFSPENAHFYFSHKDKERRVSSYEILLYRPNFLDVRVKPN